MLSKTQQIKLEQRVGPLELLPDGLQHELASAFLKSLEIERKQKMYKALYSTYAGTKDTPDRKMARYSREKPAHYGLLPGIVCSCYNKESAATPCSYVPDIRVGLPPRKKAIRTPRSGVRSALISQSPIRKLLEQYEDE